MKPLACHIDWWPGWENSPTIEVLVDDIPDYNTMKFKKKHNLYFAEKDGLIRFFYYAKPDRGFGGREFTLSMEDDTTEVLKGPWSSNSAAINTVFGVEAVEISLTKCPDVFKRGHTFFRAAVTVEFLLEALRHCQTKFQLTLIQKEDGSFHLQKTGTVREIRVIGNTLRREISLQRIPAPTKVPEVSPGPIRTLGCRIIDT